jgi:hypothetical protein
MNSALLFTTLFGLASAQTILFKDDAVSNSQCELSYDGTTNSLNSACEFADPSTETIKTYANVHNLEDAMYANSHTELTDQCFSVQAIGEGCNHDDRECAGCGCAIGKVNNADVFRFDHDSTTVSALNPTGYNRGIGLARIDSWGSTIEVLQRCGREVLQRHGAQEQEALGTGRHRAFGGGKKRRKKTQLGHKSVNLKSKLSRWLRQQS